MKFAFCLRNYFPEAKVKAAAAAAEKQMAAAAEKEMKIKKTTDRDSFRYKRVELPGILLSDLFKEYYSLQLKNIFKKIDKEYYYKEGIYQENFYNLIELNRTDKTNKIYKNIYFVKQID